VTSRAPANAKSPTHDRLTSQVQRQHYGESKKEGDKKKKGTGRKVNIISQSFPPRPKYTYLCERGRPKPCRTVKKRPTLKSQRDVRIPQHGMGCPYRALSSQKKGPWLVGRHMGKGPPRQRQNSLLRNYQHFRVFAPGRSKIPRAKKERVNSVRLREVRGTKNWSHITGGANSKSKTRWEDTPPKSLNHIPT